MTAFEKHAFINILPDTIGKRPRKPHATEDKRLSAAVYDPELLYVECHFCGKPVLWEQGRTTELLEAAGVDTSELDERCMILSEGCPACMPLEDDGYTLAVVRLAGLTPEEAAHMAKPAGTA